MLEDATDVPELFGPAASEAGPLDPGAHSSDPLLPDHDPAGVSRAAHFTHSTHSALSTRSRELPGAVKRHPAATAIGISVLVHIVLIVGGYFAIRSLHLFVPARAQFSQGDGAVETGVTDQPGEDDVAPGAEGLGAPQVGSSGFQRGPGGGFDNPGYDPAGLHTPPPPPPPAPPPEPTDEAADDAPVPPPVDLPDPLDPESWPAFTPKPPPAPPPDEAPLPPPVPAAPAPAPLQSNVQPNAGTPPGPADAAAPADALPPRQAAGGASGSANAAGYSAGPAGSDPGGLLRRPGAGGSGGAGGATTGGGGTAVTGRAGLRGAAPRPIYPELSRRLGEEGKVVLEVEVLETGAIGSIRVASDAGHPRLAGAALDAVRGTRFYPALLDGKPVRSVIPYPFIFTMRRD